MGGSSLRLEPFEITVGVLHHAFTPTFLGEAEGETPTPALPTFSLL